MNLKWHEATMELVSDTSVEMRLRKQLRRYTEGRRADFVKAGGAFDQAAKAAGEIVELVRAHDRTAAHKATSPDFTEAGLENALKASRQKVVNGVSGQALTKARQALVKRRQEIAQAGQPGEDAMPAGNQADMIRTRIANSNDPAKTVMSYLGDEQVMAVVVNSHPLSLGMDDKTFGEMVTQAKKTLNENAEEEGEEAHALDLVIGEIDAMQASATQIADEITETAKRRLRDKQRPVKRRQSNPAVAQ